MATFRIGWMGLLFVAFVFPRDGVDAAKCYNCSISKSATAIMDTNRCEVPGDGKTKIAECKSGCSKVVITFRGGKSNTVRGCKDNMKGAGVNVAPGQCGIMASGNGVETMVCICLGNLCNSAGKFQGTTLVFGLIIIIIIPPHLEVN